jgi:hypothetical protein
MSTLAVLVVLLGIVFFLFFFWRRLKEDYSGQTIFSSAFLVLIGIVLALIMTYIASLPLAFWFWAGLIGSLSGLGIGILKYDLRFFETLEAAGVGLLILVGFGYLAWALITGDPLFLIMLTVIFVLVLIFYFLEGRYRQFSWYKSGKLGFSGLMSLGIFFVVRVIIALVFPNMIFLVGRLDGLLSAIVAFVLFLAVFNLSRS